MLWTRFKGPEHMLRLKQNCSISVQIHPLDVSVPSKPGELTLGISARLHLHLSHCFFQVPFIPEVGGYVSITYGFKTKNVLLQAPLNQCTHFVDEPRLYHLIYSIVNALIEGRPRKLDRKAPRA